MDHVQDIFPQDRPRDPLDRAAILEDAHQAAAALLHAEMAYLERQLEDRFHELAVLTRHIEMSDVRENLRRAREGGGIKRLIRPLVHFRHAALVSRSAFFDPAWYAARHRGVLPKWAAYHYVQRGSFEGHDPGPDFSTMAYYLASPDVVAQGVPALVHYETSGRAEGRTVKAVTVPDRSKGR